MMESGVLYADWKEYEVVYTPDVVFARRETGPLRLQLLTPGRTNAPQKPHPSLYTELREQGVLPPMPQAKDPRRFPLIVDVPGSGWGGTTGHTHVPKMVELAKEGYVVASVEYRGTFKDDVRFPAAVQDVKEAIRFLRAHADDYLIDAERVALLGDSSGGHTAAMAALTGSEERFNIGEHQDMPTDVRSCVIFYGPNDLTNLVRDRKEEHKQLRPGEDPWPFELREIFRNDANDDPAGHLADASPINYITPGKEMPPFLFLSGDEDPIIPLRQGMRFCEKVRSCGGRAEFYRILGAKHGAGCWTADTMRLVKQFLKATL